MRIIAFAIGLVALSGAALAQDGAWGNLAGDLALSNLRHQQMEGMLGIDTWSGKGQTQARQGRAHRPSRSGSPPATSSAAFPFESNPASRLAARQTYVARIAQSDPAGAKIASAELAKHDYARIYAGLVAPFGLRANDAADAMTAYTMLGYLIATGSGDPSREQTRAARGQIAARAAVNPAMANPVQRARIGEELQLLFVTLHAGWQSARKDGSLQRYSDGVARLFKANGVDLRALRLTDRGFATS